MKTVMYPAKQVAIQPNIRGITRGFTINVTVLRLAVYYLEIQGDQKVSVHLMITIKKNTRNVQIIPRQSPDIY